MLPLVLEGLEMKSSATDSIHSHSTAGEETPANEKSNQLESLVSIELHSDSDHSDTEHPERLGRYR